MLRGFSFLRDHFFRRDRFQRKRADAVWESIFTEAEASVRSDAWAVGDLAEFGIRHWIREEILDHKTLACGLSRMIGGKLAGNNSDSSIDYHAILHSAFSADSEISDKIASDIDRFKVRGARVQEYSSFRSHVSSKRLVTPYIC